MINEKALEAAKEVARGHHKTVWDGGGVTYATLFDECVEHAITAYQAALPPVDGEAGEVVKQLRDECEETERPWFGEVADLIERLSRPPVDGEAGDILEDLHDVQLVLKTHFPQLSEMITQVRRAADLIEAQAQQIRDVEVGSEHLADQIELLWLIKKDAAAEIGRLQDQIGRFSWERKEWERHYGELEDELEDARDRIRQAMSKPFYPVDAIRASAADSGSTSQSSQPSDPSDALAALYREGLQTISKLRRRPRKP